jgi:hypothetical protein
MKQSLAVVGKVNSFKFSFERIEGMHWGAFQDGKIALMVQTSALNVDNLGVPGEIQIAYVYENIFTSWEKDYKISLGLYTPGLWSITWQTRNPYRMIMTIFKQASSWGDGSGILITRQEDI